MKKKGKKLLSLVLSLAMVLSLCVVGASATTSDVAKIDDVEYDTLANAIAAAQDGDTITLLADVTDGSGIIVDGTGDRNLTIDFAGHTYTVTNDLAGSTGTESQCFQLLKGSTITMENGTLTANNPNVQMIIQNYCNLTLQNMTLDATKGTNSVEYVMSNNCGAVNITGSTSIKAKTNTYAFDACWAPTVNGNIYAEGTQIVVDTTGAIDGNVQFDLWGVDGITGCNTTLDIKNCQLNGSVVVDANMEQYSSNISISGGTFSDLGVLPYLCQNANVSVKLLENATKDVVIPADTSVTLDLNGKTLTNAVGDTITNNGTLTVKDSAGSGSVVCDTAGKTNLQNNGKSILNGGTFSKDRNVDSHDYYVLTNHGTMTIDGAVTVTSTSTNSSLVENGWYNPSINTSEKDSVLLIQGGSFTGGLNTIKNDDYGDLTISGGSFSFPYAENACILNWNKAVINGGTFAASVPGALVLTSAAAKVGGVLPAYEAGDLKINGGSFSGLVAKSTSYSDGAITISGGYYTADPTAYLAAGKAAGTSDRSGYAFLVKDAAVGNVEVQMAVPVVNPVQVPQNADPMDESETNDLTTAAGTVSPDDSDTGLISTAGDVASTVTENDKTAATTQLKNAGVSTEDQTVSIVIQPKLEVTPQYYDSATNELTLDIKAEYDTIATTDPDNIDLTRVGTQNAVKVGDTQPLPVSDGTPVVITMAIPESMALSGGSPISSLTIKHIKENGTVYYYDANVTSVVEGQTTTYYATFTVTHGFSDFTLMAADTRTATVSYSTTGSAVSQHTYSITDVGTALPISTKSGYTFNGWTFTGLTGTYTKLPDLWAATTGTEDFTKTAAASFTYNGGGGGGNVSNCTLTFDVNGGSAISSVSKTSGTTVDLTAYVPAKNGYTFDGWYSDSAMTTQVTSVKLTANTTVYAKWTAIPFTDVNTDAYYYNAVLWAVDKGITQGTSATTFAPGAPCTRAQAVTFLWRSMGSPAPAETVNPFTDVSADAYYYNAVLWAVEKGITTGTTETTFSPDTTVNRSQVVTFLWRAAGSPAVTDASTFADVDADAYYADAVAWAAEKSITNGTSETAFSPMANCTRGQIITFLYNFEK